MTDAANSEVATIGVRLFDDAYLAWFSAESECEQALAAGTGETTSRRPPTSHTVWRSTARRPPHVTSSSWRIRVPERDERATQTEVTYQGCRSRPR